MKKRPEAERLNSKPDGTSLVMRVDCLSVFDGCTRDRPMPG
jgi:hypothetical protein